MAADHSLEQQAAAVALERVDYPTAEEEKEKLGEVESSSDIADVAAVDSVVPIHPKYDPDGNEWIYPTPDEIAGPQALRRVVDKIPWNAYLIGIVEMAERFSYYGSSAVFTNFIQRPLPPGSRTGAGGANNVSGALGLGTQASQGLTTFYSFWVYVVPLFGGYIADAYIGRYTTIVWSVWIAMLGHALMIISAIPGVITHPNSSVAVFSLSLIIMGIGTGGFKANISPLVAEQYRVTALRVKTLKTGERVIVDPVYTTGQIYMWFYLLINVGALVGQIGMTYAEKYVGFWLSYTLPTVCFMLCPIVLWIGRNRYIRSPPSGSVLATALHIVGAGMKGRWTLNPVALFRNMTAPDFWDRAKPEGVLASHGGVRPKWLNYDAHYVDEVKRGIKACQVFLFFPLYWLSYNNLNNNLTSQAATMETHGVPNDVINNLDPFALIILIPIFAEFLYPWAERMGYRFTPLKKIFWGFMMGSLAMIWSAVVQYYIYQRSACGYAANTCADADGNALPAPLNVWIQTGAYVLIAISEIFASITGLEYAFTKAPKNMRSLVMSIFFFMTALSNAIGEAMNPLAADPHLIWNYGSAAIICFVAGIGFWFSFRGLDKEEDALNLIGAGPENGAPAPLQGGAVGGGEPGLVAEKHAVV
ncbi:PTR2-domain-containing protein [Clavulina sp. PMI_390]|nr:PTR2-domain-containing protein [Clavulina sp. PMI_390]